MTTERPLDDVREQLAAIDRKLDRLLDRQDQVEELIVEFTPIVRDMMRVGGLRFAEWEQAGYFARAARLAERIGPLLDTIESVTEPDVLAVADEAAEVIHNASGVKPVGMVGMMRATGVGEVQHGMAVALEILRHLGKSRVHGTSFPGPAAVERPETPSVAPVAPTAPAQPPRAHVEPPKGEPELVEWEGRSFDAQGFLIDPTTWDEALCARMADALGVALTDEHWAVIRWVRADFLANGASPNVRRTASGSGVGTQRMYELFPKTPGKTAALLAGVPKPVGCV